MVLAANFVFSQASLQDYVDCPRRFQLRYELDVRWPAAHQGPILDWERRSRQGAAFHRLIHQHITGIPAEALDAAARENGLQEWWRAYLAAPPRDLPATVRRPELRLSTPLGDCRLVARYDLLALDPGNRAVIVDWKTSEKRPRRSWLEKRLQTLVYPYVLVKAGTQLNRGSPLDPGQIEVVYWFANQPQQTERFPYGADQHTAIEQRLSALIAEILTLVHEQWPLTSDLRRCRYCPYRTLCDREAVEGAEEEADVDPEEELLDLDLDLEQIAEIEF